MSSELLVDTTVERVSNSDVAIRVDGLGKCYQIYDRPEHRLWQGLFRGRKQFFREFWALKNVSFEVRKGETVGIIGRNGSGKSTLLQMICGTLTPTTGNVAVNGRVGALLELGAGFNPEFTGRENVYMNGTVLGLSHRDIDERFDAIAAFADIGEFIDQPLKTYSSGMFVRLAFAVVAHIDPDILVVDEALAVGDMFFQAKCMLRLHSLIEQGVTVLFVSHDTSAIRALCRRCVLLDTGKVKMLGKASDVVDAYIGDAHMTATRMLGSAQTTGAVGRDGALSLIELAGAKPPDGVVVETEREAPLPQTARRYGNGSARILDVKLLDSEGRPTEQIGTGHEFVVQVSVRFLVDIQSYVLGYSLRDLKGQMVVGGISSNQGILFPSARAGETYVYEIRSANHLQPGVYTISVGVEAPVLLNQQHLFLDVVEHVTVFRSEFPDDPRSWFHSMVYVPADYRFALASGDRATSVPVHSASSFS